MLRIQPLACVMAAGIVLSSSACARDYDDAADTVAVGGDVGVTTGAVRVADIMDNPAQYMGDTVTVEADVEEVLATFAFALDEDAALEGGIDNDMVVFFPKSAMLQDIDDQWLNNRVRVTGIVRTGTVLDIEREIEWDLTPEIEVDLTGRPVLVAHRVDRIGNK